MSVQYSGGGKQRITVTLSTRSESAAECKCWKANRPKDIPRILPCCRRSRRRRRASLVSQNKTTKQKQTLTRTLSRRSRSIGCSMWCWKANRPKDIARSLSYCWRSRRSRRRRKRKKARRRRGRRRKTRRRMKSRRRKKGGRGGIRR
jgi:hypothetical protein